MISRSTVFHVLAFACIWLSACATPRMQSAPLHASKLPELTGEVESETPDEEGHMLSAAYSVQPKAPVMSSAPISPPLESTKWSRRRDPHISPLATLGGFVGASINSMDVEGAMDGNSIIVGDEVTTLLPDIDLDPGFALSLGYRGYKYGFEISWERIEHEGQYGPVTEDTLFQLISFDFKRFFWPERQLQPYYTLGMGYLLANLESASFETANLANSGDAKLTGYTINAGLGLNYLITRRLSLDARGVYRYGEYLDNEGVLGGTNRITGDSDASSFGFIVGLQYVLNRDY